MKRPLFRNALCLLLLTLSANAWAVSSSVHQEDYSPAPRVFAGPEGLKVLEVIDGDTLYLQELKKVRLIGVDTPETSESEKLEREMDESHLSRKAIEDLGKKAKDFTEDLVKGGRVRVEYDSQHRDRYGRVLAYVYFRMPESKFAKIVGEKSDKRSSREKEYMLNRVLLQYGYGLYYRKMDYVYRKEFQTLEEEARSSEAGLWRRKKSKASLDDLPH